MSIWEKSIYEQLREYGASDFYPFHMPGHKRRVENCQLESLTDPYGIDVTEIDWNDNLHHAEGILKKSMEIAAGIYGASRSFYLVNGSTCGILSAISATARFGGRILMARNCHKSAYHGVILNHLQVEYIYPQNLHNFGVYGGLLSEDIEEIVDKYPDICAVFITSPTYEGIVSDIGKICRVLHKRGIPLIVDEAHGAHLTFGENFPQSAVDCGADVVIQSLHKTLPALTQTAILHVNGHLVDRERLARYLRIYQTSSPSYVFLSSIENCIRYMDGPGRERMKIFGKRLRQLTEQLQGLRSMGVLDDSVIGTGGVFDRDPSKLVIAAPNGRRLAEILREDYHLEMEMSNSGYVLAMTSLMDEEEGFERLSRALFEIDERWDEEGMGSEVDSSLWTRIRSCQTMPMWKAADEAAEWISLRDAVGRTAAEFVMVYPPGIPLLAPGELVTEEILEVLCQYLRIGFSLDGLKEDNGQMISVVKG